MVCAVHLRLGTDPEQLEQLVAAIEQERLRVLGMGQADRLEPALKFVRGGDPILPGQSLDERLPLPWREVVELAAQVVGASGRCIRPA